jgi:hypothetical protein
VVKGTLWYRWVRDTKKDVWYWDFNHLEDGHCENDLPTPKHPNHNQAWKGGKWAKTRVLLDDNNVVVHY